jgi:hypothetical protein
MRSLTLLFTLLVFSSLALAQDAAPTDASAGDEGEKLELFDGDADENDHGWPRFAIGVGYMWLDANGTFDVETPSGNRVTIIDLDRLGVDDKDGTPWVSLKWRSRSSNWGAWAAYWSFSGAGFRVWEDELDLGDGTIIPVGAGVATELSTDWYIVEATYSFVHNETWDVGLGAGFHVVDINANLVAAASVGDDSGAREITKFDTLAPLPNILGYARWRISDRWHLTARYGWFGLSYDDYDGEMTNLHALAIYDISERWSVEAGYQLVRLDVDVDEGNYTTLYDLDFNGPMAVLRFTF